jgi:hypothetical protein
MLFSVRRHKSTPQRVFPAIHKLALMLNSPPNDTISSGVHVLVLYAPYTVRKSKRRRHE